MVTDAFRIRPAVPADAQAIADAYLRNREHLRPFEPHRGPEFATAAGQAARLAEPGSARWVVTDGDLVIGRADLSGIVLGPFRSASLGYWIDAGYVGRGLARRAVREVCRAARDELGLHRLDAGTLLDNHASQRVLAACGFERYGTAPEYLHINGRWRDHHLFQRILHDGPPACP
ncbi:GNAT family N-acetyltransferase [Streptomyces sp. NPDC055059]|jgi:ribosomal-protein-alanine N-acetyltransferase|uniref:GNAT family N-acetyltransferase n=1 Tax=Streptomyces sp. NBC_00119 TaxID=2975659 RepID=A0AAU1UBD8_9ACTN|nr:MULTISPECIES: GNAT family protein [unclassified Streptomyces]MCX4645121.1 GNAT family N-acetyltransferase [Streptomyces sp. NBC_01446]MCX5326109.1 GNAT family N-acetyltransferase [Streptomyces sp. NBC_00120]